MGLLTPAITPRGKCSTIRYGPYTQHTPHILAETKLACNAQDNIIPANPPFRGSAPAFHKTARILPFRPQDLPIPTPRRDYNDDVDLQHFSSASRSYADKQRKGLQEEHLDSLDMADHLDQALSAPFFLSLPTPLPHSLSSQILIMLLPLTLKRSFPSGRNSSKLLKPWCLTPDSLTWNGTGSFPGGYAQQLANSAWRRLPLLRNNTTSGGPSGFNSSSSASL